MNRKCDYCQIKEIENNAKERKWLIYKRKTIISHWPNGVDIFVVPRDVKIKPGQPIDDRWCEGWFPLDPIECTCRRERPTNNGR